MSTEMKDLDRHFVTHKTLFSSALKQINKHNDGQHKVWDYGKVAEDTKQEECRAQHKTLFMSVLKQISKQQGGQDKVWEGDKVDEDTKQKECLAHHKTLFMSTLEQIHNKSNIETKDKDEHQRSDLLSNVDGGLSSLDNKSIAKHEDKNVDAQTDEDKKEDEKEKEALLKMDKQDFPQANTIITSVEPCLPTTPSSRLNAIQLSGGLIERCEKLAQAPKSVLSQNLIRGTGKQQTKDYVDTEKVYESVVKKAVKSLNKTYTKRAIMSSSTKKINIDKTTCNNKQKINSPSKMHKMRVDLERKQDMNIKTQKKLTLSLELFQQALAKMSRKKLLQTIVRFHEELVELNKNLLVSAESLNLIQNELEKLRNYMCRRAVGDSSLDESLTLSPSAEHFCTRKESRGTLLIQEVCLLMANTVKFDLKDSTEDLFVFGLVEHKAKLKATEVLKVKRDKAYGQTRTCLGFKSNLVVEQLKPNFEVVLKFFVMQQKSFIKKPNIVVDGLKKFTKWLLNKYRTGHYNLVADSRKEVAQALRWRELDDAHVTNVPPRESDFKLLGDITLNRWNFYESNFTLDHANVTTSSKSMVYIDAELSHQS